MCGDEVYGSCTRLREFLEDQDQAYVLRVPSSFRLILPGGVTLTCKQAAARLTRRGWEVRSAGTGSKGQRWYAWAWLGTASARHHLLIRRHLDTGELPVAPVHCCTGAPSGPCMPLVAAHGPGKPPGRFRCLASARVPPAAVAVGCRCRVRGVFACRVRHWACHGGPGSPP